jgi:hypothetical protein
MRPQESPPRQSPSRNPGRRSPRRSQSRSKPPRPRNQVQFEVPVEEQDTRDHLLPKQSSPPYKVPPVPQSAILENHGAQLLSCPSRSCASLSEAQVGNSHRFDALTRLLSQKLTPADTPLTGLCRPRYFRGEEEGDQAGHHRQEERGGAGVCRLVHPGVHGGGAHQLLRCLRSAHVAVTKSISGAYKGVVSSAGTWHGKGRDGGTSVVPPPLLQSKTGIDTRCCTSNFTWRAHVPSWGC